tara:strand:+ start:1542 stop:2204 length:663 start_codon:yes stop_codon:yes gene_type:complete
MRKTNTIIVILCVLMTSTAFAKKSLLQHIAKPSRKHNAPIVTTPSDLTGFDKNPDEVKQLIADALELGDQQLAYKFGSTDPRNHGMDCSGAISYLLKHANIRDVPRRADEIYKWAWKKGEFNAVNSHHFGTFEFSKLKPGDLLFWSGTYPVKRDPAVTHVMLYIGRDKHNRPLMFGANSGGTYLGKSQYGVSVFDFKLPSAKSKVRFLGYACIPHLSCQG